MPYRKTQIADARKALNRLSLYLNGTPIDLALRHKTIDNLPTSSLTISRIHEFADLPQLGGRPRPRAPPPTKALNRNRTLPSCTHST